MAAAATVVSRESGGKVSAASGGEGRTVRGGGHMMSASTAGAEASREEGWAA